ncbi:MAG: LysR family transcriptional regulator [Hyphomonadaceae bacterium]
MTELAEETHPLAGAVDLRHLHYFKLFAEELHFGRAARRAHSTQPALGRQVQRLEDMLGVKLFERDRKLLRLTNAGEALFAHAREMEDRIKAAVLAARSAAEN